MNTAGWSNPNNTVYMYIVILKCQFSSVIFVWSPGEEGFLCSGGKRREGGAAVGQQAQVFCGSVLTQIFLFQSQPCQPLFTNKNKTKMTEVDWMNLQFSQSGCSRHRQCGASCLRFRHLQQEVSDDLKPVEELKTFKGKQVNQQDKHPGRHTGGHDLPNIHVTSSLNSSTA